MSTHFLSARRASDDLAAGRIGAPEQSLYLVASFLIWIIPAYLFLFPAPRTDDAAFFWGMWLVELALVIVFCILGIGFCLRQCRVDPARHFLVDFSCLNAPVSLTTLAVVWGAFYLVSAALSVLWPDFASSRVYDVLRMLASAAAVLIVFLRIGRHMRRVSALRERSPAGQAAS